MNRIVSRPWKWTPGWAAVANDRRAVRLLTWITLAVLGGPLVDLLLKRPNHFKLLDQFQQLRIGGFAGLAGFSVFARIGLIVFARLLERLDHLLEGVNDVLFDVLPTTRSPPL